jgi:protoporphyrinogen oxidase
MTPRVAILGGGLAGISTAYHLSKATYNLYERDAHVGGTARSFKVDGFTFDITGHLLHLHNPYTKKLISGLLQNNFYNCIRKTWIFSENTYTPYPYQAYTNGLPESSIDENVLGCFDAIIAAQTKKINPAKLDFQAWSQAQFGRGIAAKFMKPYNEKLYQVPANKLNTEWCGAFVPQPDLADVIRGALEKTGKTFGYNATFLYPKRGGIQVLAEKLSSSLRNIHLRTAVGKIDWKRRVVRLENGDETSYTHLVNTLPLVEFLKRVIDLPVAVREAAKQLNWASVYCVNLGVKRPHISDASWIYFPEPKFIFYRVGFPMNFTPHVVPKGCSSMYVEVPTKTAVNLSSKQLIARVRKDLIEARILKQSDKFATVQVIPIKYAYVIYDHNRRKAMDVIFKFLKANNIQSIGRYGAWKYSFMEEAILDGKKAAEAINHGRKH